MKLKEHLGSWSGPTSAVIGAGPDGPVEYPFRYDERSTAHGMILGGTGAGTTNLAVVITAAIRAAVPTMTVHVDPLGGRSSSALSRHATASLLGEDQAIGAPWFLETLVRHRELDAANDPDAVLRWPVLMVVVHEPQLVFTDENSARWARLLGAGAKLGMVALSVGGSGSLADYGGDALRKRFANVIGMRCHAVAPRFALARLSLAELPPGRALMLSTQFGGVKEFDVPLIDADEVLTQQPDMRSEELRRGEAIALPASAARVGLKVCPGCRVEPASAHRDWCDRACCPGCGEQLLMCEGECGDRADAPALWHGVNPREEVARTLGWFTTVVGIDRLVPDYTKVTVAIGLDQVTWDPTTQRYRIGAIDEHQIEAAM